MQPITNINHAILFLGVIPVKTIAMQLAIQSDVKFENKEQNKAYKKLWTASYLSSSFCSLITKKMNEDNSAELSTCCLLSYLGDLALLSYDPAVTEYYNEDHTFFERTQFIQNKYGVNSAMIGKFIAKQWQLPDSIVLGIDNSLLMITNNRELTKLSVTELKKLVLCYLACRLSDLVAFQGINTLPELNEVSYDAIGRVEFYYLQRHIEQANLAGLNQLIAEPALRIKLNKLIAQLES
jgi:HD-like signal output (HDOD) protein